MDHSAQSYFDHFKLQTPETVNYSCDNRYEWAELKSEVLTIIIFLVGAAFRYKYLKGSGKENPTWTSFFKVKLVLLALMILLHIVYLGLKITNGIECEAGLAYSAAIGVEAFYILGLILAVLLLMREYRAKLTKYLCP